MKRHEDVKATAAKLGSQSNPMLDMYMKALTFLKERKESMKKEIQLSKLGC